ncbi:hypothetical protein D8674_012182 [Pyrus ussuriensis x Pyrus communis]|uniref:Xylanase inhibitor N-terminal domain-containing protein n=1 Tax=Pyrus ussuriensis x Pyrus communis TaxID=2448454 RepID=A0A5N5GE67_9ROSA|nr:hypothetical protein D8674_012182 [Pyrus ussuriensis x Pyrus communis]
MPIITTNTTGTSGTSTHSKLAGTNATTNQPLTNRKSARLQKFGSSAVFLLHENRFDLDIDTGNNLTWLQCDAPCTGCTKPRKHLYKTNNNLLGCEHPLCVAFHSLASNPCKTPDDQCDNEVEYADYGLSLGTKPENRKQNTKSRKQNIELNNLQSCNHLKLQKLLLMESLLS